MIIVLNFKRWGGAKLQKFGKVYLYRRIYCKGKWTPFVKRERI